MTVHRRNMRPYHLETLLFLRCNFSLWDASIIQDAIESDPDVSSDSEGDELMYTEQLLIILA